MAYSYKGSISFGLVYIPIKLFSATKSNDISFNMLEKNTLSRIKYKKTCIDCEDKEVKNEDIVKGYQYEKDKYVVITDDDLEKIKTKKDKNITIEQFVNLEEIDPVYYDKAYYVVSTGGEKAFALLLKAMEDKNKVGIAKTVLGTKETLIAIRVKDGKMLLNTLFFRDDVQVNPAHNIEAEINEKELNLAEILIKGMSSKFDPEKYKDEYREKLQKVIEAKIAGKQIAIPKEKAETKIINLMQALEKSVKSYKKDNIKKAQ